MPVNDWQRIWQQRRAATTAALNSRMPSYGIPVRDSAAQAPGWLFLDEQFSCVPDSTYPWDPAVVRAIREFCPDAQPILIRSTWQRSWSEDSPYTLMTLTRHGIARNVRDATLPVHEFRCDMPAVPIPGITLERPNYIEVNWYDKQVRPYGPDLPGEYLPFDWELYAALRRSYEDSLTPYDLAKKYIDPYQELLAHKEQRRKEEGEYVNRDLSNYYSKEPSDIEWRNALFGPPKEEPKKLQFTVPGVPGH